jgi:Zn finger protein HypA/HybF involved in hydrogenase expression
MSYVPSPDRPRAEASCPACGAPISFKISSSIVVVCEHCHSVIARTDRALEDLGRVAEIAQTESPLRVGLRGVWRGVPFELTGRAQLQHSAGGMWDEWYAAFDNGHWGWLAEAQGRFYLTFQQGSPDNLPSFEQLEVGRPVSNLPFPVPFVVAEKGQARAFAAEGEIPYRLVPGETNLYADLSGANGDFATIDYGDQPASFYAGRETPLAELGFPPDVRAPEGDPKRVAAEQLNCPNCAGPLSLVAPDKTERVTCPNCGSLLDVNQGKLQFLHALDKNLYKPTIPLGSMGNFERTQMMIIGAMMRGVQIEGVNYYWEEFLLYNPHVGFRWLVYSDNHWSFVTPVPPGEVIDTGRTAQYGGKSYKIFQDATAHVVAVMGEFYWKVTVGEAVRATDYVRPPNMLSKEISTLTVTDANGQQQTISGSEINWSLGSYTTPREVEAAFNTSGFAATPQGIAPNQPYRHKAIYLYWFALVALVFVIGIFSFVSSPNRQVLRQDFQFPPLPNDDATQIVFSDPIQLENRNLRIDVSSSVSNSWITVMGNLINEETGDVETFVMPISYYSGVEDGESWSEGGSSASASTGTLPAGRYILRLEAQWGDNTWSQPATVNVRITQGTPRYGLWIFTLVMLSIFPLLMLFYHYSFEKRRWSNSSFSPYETSE